MPSRVWLISKRALYTSSMLRTNATVELNTLPTEIIDVINRPDTQLAIASLKKSKRKVTRNHILRFMKSFSLPPESLLLVENYFETNQFDFTLMKPRIMIETRGHTIGPFVNDDDFFRRVPKTHAEDNKRILLSLSPHVTKLELKKFIDLYWETGIAPFLDKAAGKPSSHRVRQKERVELHNRIIQMKMDGKNATQIADILTSEMDENDMNASVGVDYVRKVLQRKKSPVTKRDTKS